MHAVISCGLGASEPEWKGPRTILSARGGLKSTGADKIVRAPKRRFIAGAGAAGASGFSLLEVLVAVGLLAFIIVSLTVMFGEVKRVTRRGTNQVEIMEGARATMGMLSQYLQQASPAQRDDLVNLRVTLTGQPILPVTNGAIVIPRIYSLQNVFVLSRSGDEWSVNQFAFERLQAAGGVPTLYLRDTNTFGLANGYGWQTPKFVTTNSPDFEDAWDGSNSPYHRVIEGVVHLSVLPYGPEGMLMTNDVYVTNTVFNTVSTNYSVAGTPPHTYTFYNSFLPTSLELEVGIVERETLAELRAFAGSELTNRASIIWFLAQRPEKIHFFRQRIPIHAVHRIVP